MKSNLLSTSLLTLACLAAAATGFATAPESGTETLPGTPLAGPAPADAQPGWGQRAPGEINPELLKRFDKNGDGRIDEQERAAAREQMARGGGPRPGPAMREQIMKRFDHNGDGQLDEAERAEMEQAREEFMQKRAEAGAALREEALKRFDKNGDGRLDEQERAEARTQMGRADGAPRPGAAMREQALKRFDRNGDGQLDEQERAAAREEMKQRRPGGQRPPGS